MSGFIRSYPQIALLIVVGNILLTLWCRFADPVINIDGILYLTMAGYFSEGQAFAAFEQYSWPIYSYFISFISDLFSISPENSAYTLNTALYILLSFAFVLIVNELKPNDSRLLLIAAIVVLCFPSLNKYRSYIIRDIGYLCFYLWSLFSLFRYSHTNKILYLGLWLLFTILACLFRLEGIFFVVLVPLLFLVWKFKGTRYYSLFLLALATMVLFSAIALLSWFLATKYGSVFRPTETSQSYLQYSLGFFIENLQDKLTDQKNSIVSLAVLFFTITGTVLYETARRLAFLYLFLSIYTYMKKLVLTIPLDRKIWLSYVWINFVMLWFFHFVSDFFVSRYAMALVLTVLVLSPFAIDHLLKKRIASVGMNKGLLTGLFVLLALVSVKGLDVWTKKRHIKDAGLWMQSNLPTDTKIYSNNSLLLHYAGQNPFANVHEMYNDDRATKNIQSGSIKQYNYFAFLANTAKPKMKFISEVAEESLGEPVKVIAGESKQQVFLYKIE